MARRNTNKALRPRDLGVIAVLAAVGAALTVVLDNSGGSAPGSSDSDARGEISSPARPEFVPSPPIEPNSQMMARDVAAPNPTTATPAEPLSTGSIDANRSPMECVPASLKTVLNEVSARFGPLTIVSTTLLQTDNHVSGSDREKLHAACKAVDFESRVLRPTKCSATCEDGGRSQASPATGAASSTSMPTNDTRSPQAADSGGLAADDPTFQDL